MRARKERLYHNGIPERCIFPYQVATQTLASFIPLEKLGMKSKRHGRLDPELQRAHYFYHQGVDGNGSPQGEPIGTLHLCRGWPQLGHPTEPMTPSGAHASRADAFQHIERWHRARVEIAVVLDMMFEHEYPDQLSFFRKAHRAAQWYEYEVGGYHAEVIVYKCFSKSHVDDGDKFPTATWPCGSFTGGYMEVLDLSARFAYFPGHVVLGWTAFLFHRVSDWEVVCPSEDVQKRMSAHRVTPGRISSVSFFPTPAYKQLYGKAAGWAKDTQWGKLQFEE
ncbi:hypothetical protein BDZ89DRAFT_1055517 [Hymenopellis radicata]|nr:hypothetical protein BDZ89DRAFT_1055517 [Hymenopellis radicata]